MNRQAPIVISAAPAVGAITVTATERARRRGSRPQTARYQTRRPFAAESVGDGSVDDWREGEAGHEGAHRQADFRWAGAKRGASRRELGTIQVPEECPSVRGPPRENPAHRNLHALKRNKFQSAVLDAFAERAAGQKVNSCPSALSLRVTASSGLIWTVAGPKR
jgi:hypothetical protein